MQQWQLATLLPLASKPYCKGEFVKTYMLKATEIMCILSDVILPTIAFFVAIEESTDIIMLVYFLH